MIHKLKRKFLVIATVFMFLLMTVLVLIMNLVNYREVVSESDSVLDMLTQPDRPDFEDHVPPAMRDDVKKFVPHGMSPEVPYESRFFDVIVDSEGNVLRSDLSRIVSVDEEAAKSYVEKALSCSQARGFIGSMRFLKSETESGKRIVFLDCGRKLDSFRSFLWISVIVGLAGCLLVFVAFIFTAGRIVKPIAESYEKQKRFISDAGHEIKTPLTIINANVDLLELDGEKEELTEIRSQTTRLTELTNHLILLSKMEEHADSMQKIEFPLSDVINETVSSFRAPAGSRLLEVRSSVAPDVTLFGSPDAIRNLVTILMENAVKYSPEGDTILVDLSLHRRSVILSVTNATMTPVAKEDLPHVFDRFYRTDESRNSSTGGHGIGLSIARAITEAHGGSIAATTKTGSDFTVTVTLPA